MCLPAGFLKIYNSIGAAITILASLFGIIYSLILIINDKGNVGLQSDHRNKICWALFGTSFILMFFAALALFGILKRKNVLQLSYNVALIISVIIYFALAIAASTIPFKILENGCAKANPPKWSAQLQTFVNSANQTFCQLTCPCSFSNTTFHSYPQAYQANIFAYLPYMSLNNSKLPQQVNQCPDWSQDNSDNYQMMQELENNFGCSGWCEETVTYYFTTSSTSIKNPPNSSCFIQLGNYYEIWGKKLMVGCWIIMGIITLNAILVLCYVFHPQKRASSLYQRLSG